jgi:protein-disulfide isomerase
VSADYVSGVQSGVTGTPTFFINGMSFVGEKDEASLRQAIRSV